VDFQPCLLHQSGCSTEVVPARIIPAWLRGQRWLHPSRAHPARQPRVQRPHRRRQCSPSQLAPYCSGINASSAAAARRILHDKVVAICPSDDGFGGTVTLELTTGFSFGKPVLYLSMEASHNLTAALERVTGTPLGSPGRTRAETTDFGSSVERIFVTTNGYTNGDVNPGKVAGATRPPIPFVRASTLLCVGTGSPSTCWAAVPTVATDYSPSGTSTWASGPAMPSSPTTVPASWTSSRTWAMWSGIHHCSRRGAFGTL